MNQKTLLLLIGILILAIVVVRYQEIKEFLLTARHLMLSGVTTSRLSRVLDPEPVDFVLPDLIDEDQGMMAIEEFEEQEEIAGVQDQIVWVGAEETTEAPEKQMSLAEIQDEVNEIEKKVDILTVKVESFVSAEKAKQARILELQQQIEQISSQIEILSQEMIDNG